MSNRIQQIMGVLDSISQGEEAEQFRIDAQDFLSARERGEAEGTQITQMTASINEAAEIVNRSFRKRDGSGQYTNVVSPVVIPKRSRSYGWLFLVFVFVFMGIVGVVIAGAIDAGTRIVPGMERSNLAGILFGPHYWLLIVIYIAFSWWRNSLIMVPDGCQALITKFGRLEKIVPAGRTMLLDPWKRVSYIVNTTKEYPYNAPIREAPTAVVSMRRLTCFCSFGWRTLPILSLLWVERRVLLKSCKMRSAR